MEGIFLRSLHGLVAPLFLSRAGCAENLLRSMRQSIRTRSSRCLQAQVSLLSCPKARQNFRPHLTIYNWRVFALGPKGGYDDG
jgi:hypothetical protein